MPRMGRASRRGELPSWFAHEAPPRGYCAWKVSTKSGEDHGFSQTLAGVGLYSVNKSAQPAHLGHAHLSLTPPHGRPSLQRTFDKIENQIVAKQK